MKLEKRHENQRKSSLLMEGTENENHLVKEVKFLDNNPVIWDNISLNPGVTLKYEGKVKTVSRPQTTTIGNLSNPNIRLTKTQYLSLTQGGSLNRDNLTIDKRNIESAGTMGFDYTGSYRIPDKYKTTDGFFDESKKKKSSKKIIALLILHFFIF